MRIGLVFLFLVAATAAAAQPTDKAAAQALFEEGRRLLDAGDAAGACVKFEASARLEPAPGTTLNLARCNEELGKIATAWALYLEVRDRSAGNAKRAAFASERAAALAPRLPRLRFRIVAPIPGLLIQRDGAPVDSALWSSAIPVDPGPRTIEASAPGHLPWSATVRAAEGVVVELEVSALEPVPAAPIDATRDEGTALRDLSPSTSGAPSSRRRTLGLALAGTGVAALGTGLVFGALARSSYRDALSHCDAMRACDDEGLALDRTARSRATLSTILVGAGLATTAAGAFLFVTAPRTRAIVTPTGDGATVTFAGSF